MGFADSARLVLRIYFDSSFVGIPILFKLATTSGNHRALAYAVIYGGITLPLVVFFPTESF